MNAHPLQQSVSRLRRRARRLLLLYGMSRVVLVTVGAATALGLAGWLLRIEDPGLRVMASATVLAVFGWAVVRYLIAAIFRPLDDLEVALRIERRFPQLEDRLASTIEFLKQPDDDPQRGSPTLRQAVIEETTAAVRSLDLNEAIETRPARHALGAAAIVCLIAAILSFLEPTAARVAVVRLLNPFANQPWPQRHHLQFRHAVRRVALGDDFEVELVDAQGAKLPQEAWIQYRMVDGNGQAIVEEQPMLLVGDTLLARREGVTRPFSYRAYGGDDNSMPWIDVEVVEPPALTELRIELRYPDYTGWSPRTSGRSIRALVGTRAIFTGATTKPVRRVTIETSYGKTYAAKVFEDGFRFVVGEDGNNSLVVEESGSYWFVLEGRDGLTGGQDQRYDLRAVQDLAPSVSIDEPPGNVYVTSRAVIPMKIVAKDDLRLSRIALNYARDVEPPAAPARVILYDSPRQQNGHSEREQNSPAPEARDRTAPAPSAPADNASSSGDVQTVEYVWEIAPLELSPGTQLTFFATATDDVPSTGESPRRRLFVVTDEQLEDRLAQRQSVILGELARALELQRKARQKTTAVQIQAERVGRLNKADVDQLQTAELGQRQVDRTLRHPTDGIRQQVRSLLADLANNKIDNPDLAGRMNDLASELDRLSNDHLPIVQRELTAALKAAQTDLETHDTGSSTQNDRSNAAPTLKQSLKTAEQHQQEIVAALEQALAGLSQWDQFRRLHRELADVRASQQQVAEETARLARQTLSKSVDELTPQQQADAKKLAAQQQDLARQFDSLRQRLRQMQQHLAAEDPLAAEIIDDALHHAQDTMLSGQMSQIAEQVRRNRMGQAVSAQQQVASDLEEMLDILANRREQQLERLVKKLREAERQLAEIRRQQEGLRKKMRHAAKIADEQQRREQLKRLTRQQRELEQRARRFARRLKRLQADAAEKSVAQGAARMGDTGQQASADQAGRAAQQSQAAEKDLEQAQAQLAQRRREAERDLAMEQLVRIEDTLSSLQKKQKKLLDETQRLHEVQDKQGRLSRGQLITLADLAAEQQALTEETKTVAEKVAAAAAFHLALTTAAERMAEAKALLSQRKVGLPTQRAEQIALDRVAMLLEAMKPDNASQAENQGEGQGGEEGGQNSAQPTSQEAIADITQLKLIKLLQQDLNLRTRELTRELTDREISASQREQYARLSAEQGRLADLVRNLMKTSTETLPEDDPDKLPNVDEMETPDDKLLDPQKSQTPAGLDDDLLDPGLEPPQSKESP